MRLRTLAVLRYSAGPNRLHNEAALSLFERLAAGRGDNEPRNDQSRRGLYRFVAARGRHYCTRRNGQPLPSCSSALCTPVDAAKYDKMSCVELKRGWGPSAARNRKLRSPAARLFKQIVQTGYEAASASPPLSLPRQSAKIEQMRRQETVKAAARNKQMLIFALPSASNGSARPGTKKECSGSSSRLSTDCFSRIRPWQERELCAVKSGLRHSMNTKNLKNSIRGVWVCDLALIYAVE